MNLTGYIVKGWGVAFATSRSIIVEEPVAKSGMESIEWAGRWQMLKKDPAKLFAWLKSYKWNRGRMKEVKGLRVRCHGKIHSVDITPGGRIKMHGHPKAETDAMKMLITMGAKPPRCFDIVEVLTGKNSKWSADQVLPQELAAYSAALRYIRQVRRQVKNVNEVTPLKQRLTGWLTKSVAMFRMHDQITVEGAQSVVVGIGVPKVRCLPEVYVTDDGTLAYENAQLVAQVPRAWARWNASGYGLIDQHLIIDVRRNQARVRVLAVHVHKGKPVAEWHYAKQTPSGVWQLLERVPKMKWNP